jgi:hypothetical protein
MCQASLERRYRFRRDAYDHLEPLPIRAGLLAVAVVLGSMTIAATPAAASTASGITCGPKSTTTNPAPGIGSQASFSVGNGGTVTLVQESNTTLRVTSTNAKSGWKVNVATSQRSTHPQVGFQRLGMPNDQERFRAHLNTKGTPGTVLTVVIESCT